MVNIKVLFIINSNGSNSETFITAQINGHIFIPENLRQDILLNKNFRLTTNGN